MKVNALVVWATFVWAGAVSANLLTNPGFSTEGSGGAQDAADWTETSNCGREAWGSHDGDGYLMAQYGWNTQTSDQFYQDVTGATEGYTYTLSFWHEGDSGWNGTAVSASLVWLDNEGSSIGTPATVDLQPYFAESWSNRTLSGVAPSGTATVRVQFDATKPDGGSGSQKFDELDLVAIPEPTAMSLLGFTIAGLMSLRRRRHS